MYALTARFTVLPNMEERAEDAFRDAVTEIRENEPGTLVMAYHKVIKEERVYFAYEIYRDKEAFKFHLARMDSSIAFKNLNSIIESRGDAERSEIVAQLGP
jgi:quinol monooxygenase YgiN